MGTITSAAGGEEQIQFSNSVQFRLELRLVHCAV